MQSKSFSFVSVAAVLASLGVPSSEAETEVACNTYLPSSINCSPAKSIEDVQQFLRNLSASNITKDIDRFYINENKHIQYLPVGLLDGFRFTQIFISNCTQLSRVDDFIGTSGASVRRIEMHHNALTEVPALSAPNLVNLHIHQTTPMAVSREAFKGMANIGGINFSNIRVRPNAFVDLKNLKFLEVLDMPNETVVAGAFHFTSPGLRALLLQSNQGWQGQAQPGAYDGFINGSIISVFESTKVPEDVYFNILNSGAILRISKPLDCDCNVAWLRFAPFVSNAQIKCRTGSSEVALASTPEENFAHCPRN